MGFVDFTAVVDKEGISQLRGTWLYCCFNSASLHSIINREDFFLMFHISFYLDDLGTRYRTNYCT